MKVFKTLNNLLISTLKSEQFVEIEGKDAPDDDGKGLAIGNGKFAIRQQGKGEPFPTVADLKTLILTDKLR